jgi:hypothetical protein
MLKGWNPLKPGHSGNNMLNYWLNGEKRPEVAVQEISGYGENVLETDILNDNRYVVLSTSHNSVESL